MSFESLPVDVIKNTLQFVEIYFRLDLDNRPNNKKDNIKMIIKQYYGKKKSSDEVFFLFPFVHKIWQPYERDALLLLMPLFIQYRKDMDTHMMRTLLGKCSLMEMNRRKVMKIPTQADRDNKKKMERQMEVSLLQYFKHHDQFAKSVTSISLQDVDVTQDFLKGFLAHFSKLKHLSIGCREFEYSSCFGDQEFFIDAPTIHSVNQLKELESLYIVEGAVKSNSFHHFEPNGHLKRFMSISDCSVDEIASVISKWKNLESITTKSSGNSYSSDSTKFFQQLIKLQKIKQLCINSSQLQGFHLLGHHKTIQYLDLSRCNISSNHMKTIGTLSNLKVLILDAAKFNRKDLMELIPLKNSLKSLSIEQSSNCGNEGCSYISQITSLETLSLYNLMNQDKMNDKGAKYLAKLKNLEEISLFSDVTETTIKLLISSCKNLKRIIIDKKFKKLNNQEPTLIKNNGNINYHKCYKKYCN